ncbi:MAG: NUDIX domain-containing protein [Methanogenium sp.]
MLHRAHPTADVGIIVGRFQVPYLHSEHIELLETVKANHRKVIVFLGVSPLLTTTNNPLDFESRKQMILEKFPSFTVLYIKDTADDGVWSKHLDEQISDVVPPTQTVLLYGSRDSFISRYYGKYDCQELLQKNYISGTQLRQETKNEAISSADFRKGVIWAAYNRFATAYTTVDIAILNEQKTKVLLASKYNRKGKMFVGGFSSPESNSFEDDARREVMEETGLEIADLKYIGSFSIDDWRYRGEVDKIKTLFFTAQYVFGNPTAQDDISDIEWFDVNDILKVILPGHLPLAKRLLEIIK